MYPATLISSYIINFCSMHNIQITNLKLQKLLYYLQGEGCRHLGKRLISEDFYAWRLGPVIPEVYHQYAIYSSLPLPSQKETFDLEEDTLSFLDNVLFKYAWKSSWDLVEQSHNQDPWKYTFEVFGNKAVIPFESIKSYFCEGRDDE